MKQNPDSIVDNMLLRNNIFYIHVAMCWCVWKAIAEALIHSEISYDLCS